MICQSASTLVKPVKFLPSSSRHKKVILTGVMLMQATQKETQTTSSVKCSRRSQVAPQERASSKSPVITHSRPPIWETKHTLYYLTCYDHFSAISFHRGSHYASYHLEWSLMQKRDTSKSFSFHR